MNFEEALRERLLGAGSVTALVAQRVYWVDRPQLTGLPAVTLQIIDDDRSQHMGGFQSLQFVDVQIDVWAKTYASGKAIKEAIIDALIPEAISNGIKFGRAFVRARDLSERTETQMVHRPSLDFRFNYSLE